MDRSSKSISLVLIGSAVFLSGCKAKNDEAARLAALKRQRECEQAKKEGKDCPPEPARGGGARTGVVRTGFFPYFWGSGSSGGSGVAARPATGSGTVSTGASARGGFGSTGAAHASGSAAS